MKEKMDKIAKTSKTAAQKARETASRQTSGFLDFVREQGVITLAVGFIIGGAVTKLVNSFVVDVINPVLGLLLGKVNLTTATFKLGTATIAWGNFVSALIDFFVIAAVVYFGFKFLRLDRIDIDKKKREKEAEVEANKEQKAEKSAEAKSKK
ncbi:MAG: large conductance mechanosensitive channel [Patescibacteria group bacterium]|jgi:large conductance mechanosensitive channel|nr:large conductance mechanosensitive channel [Patescibacteria group bacterium]